ncbi:filament-like plant protein 4 [Quillaja saponaria]|uniref:Filament-like plant protein 4 n=1 Tax=Quillaja saponaria TaxID=32244 RepID=A0AAD7LHA1_QUISA|nr:filament-like plant protein 4 [Quillaja saponaria]
MGRWSWPWKKTLTYKETAKKVAALLDTVDANSTEANQDNIFKKLKCVEISVESYSYLTGLEDQMKTYQEQVKTQEGQIEELKNRLQSVALVKLGLEDGKGTIQVSRKYEVNIQKDVSVTAALVVTVSKESLVANNKYQAKEIAAVDKKASVKEIAQLEADCKNLRDIVLPMKLRFLGYTMQEIRNLEWKIQLKKSCVNSA